ncbi:MAG: glucuronyl hydrolase [Opitutaceae bacterium]|nr:glucuronyl hydrolase [Opitutaceae bacterium]
MITLRLFSFHKLSSAIALSFMLGLRSISAVDTPPAPLRMVIQQAFTASAQQYRWLLAQPPLAGKFPRSFEHNQLITITAKDWTSGFFPGSLWYLYEATGDAQWREAATRFTEQLEKVQYNTGTHDVGFILMSSYGQGYRLTGNAAYRPIILQGAISLSTRFNTKIGSLKSWDRPATAFTFPVIIDNLMNLELLLWAARNGGEPQARTIALTHADTGLKNHFRPDGSSVHVVDYDPVTGQIIRRITHQGFSNDSSWSRGQAWALYGYTMLYRETRELRYLAQAEKIAAFIINHPRLPADKIPYWDFDAPQQPEPGRDASAGAIICSALFELASLTKNPTAAAQYAALAETQLRSLASPAYFAAVGTNGGFLLKHGTGNQPKKSEIDAPLNYADYYFLEALHRAQANRAR